MTCVLFAAVTLVVLSPEASAGERVVRLQVDPMPEPKPALKYQLLPEVRELNPGNPAQNYLKCFMEQRIFFFSKIGVDQRTRYLAMPLAKLRAEKVTNYGGQALRQADRAARMEGLDWQAAPEVQAGSLQRPPAELGPLQVLALALKVRLRVEAAGRKYDDAVHTAKTMFALGRHLGEYPAGLASEVGMWVVHQALGSLEEMVQEPGCPNLYWALADLPSPLVDLRKGVQGDCTVVEALLRPIRGDVPMTEAEIEACVSRLSGAIGFAREQAGRPPRSLRSRLAARANDPDQLSLAQRHVNETGSALDAVKKRPSLETLLNVARKRPPLQVILQDEKRAYEIERDARIKVLALPLWQIDEPRRDGDGLLDDLLPDILKLRRMQAVLEQEIALLRHVEALRLYAAGHSGRLPATLSETSVPLPVDPFTGRAFKYDLDGTTARLRGGAQQTEEVDPKSRLCFEVILRN